MNKIRFILIMVAAMAAIACNPLQLNEEAPHAGDFSDPIYPRVYGKVSVDITIDVENEALEPTRAPEEQQPLIEGMILEFFFIAPDGTTRLAKHYDRYSDMPSIVSFPVGTYRVVAKSTATMADVQDDPYFYGQTMMTVKDGSNALGMITCLMQNSRMTVITNEGFGESFSQWNAKFFFQDQAAEYLAEFSNAGNRGKFVKPAAFGLHIVATQVGDEQLFYDTLLVDKVRPAEDVMVELKAQSGGTLHVSLSINGTIIIKEHEVLVPDTDEGLGGDDDDKPVLPTVVGDGFDVDQVKELSTANDFVDQVVKEPMVVTIAAPAGGGIQQLMITIDSPDIGIELLEPLFGGTSFDLANVPAGTPLEENLDLLGILKKGTVVKGTPQFLFDLSAFMGLLPENAITHNFIIKVRDGAGATLEKTIKISRIP